MWQPKNEDFLLRRILQVVPCAKSLIMEVLVEIGVHIQKLLQCGAAPGAGVVDGEIGWRKAAAGEAPDHHPMLAAVLVGSTQKHRFSLFQQVIDPV